MNTLMLSGTGLATFLIASPAQRVNRLACFTDEADKLTRMHRSSQKTGGGNNAMASLSILADFVIVRCGRRNGGLRVY